MAGRKPITAIHCDEYTAKVRPTSHGARAPTVVRRRAGQPVETLPGAAGRSLSVGTASHTQSAAPAETSDNAHHQSAHPPQAINAGPSSSAIATPSGMYAPHNPSAALSAPGGVRARIKPGPGITAS